MTEFGNMDPGSQVEPSRAESDSLLGLIQRGRGASYYRALSEPEAAREFVLDCIVHDPRWDHQVEHRGWLYATLIAELGVELPLLRAAYTKPADPRGDSDAWLAISTLELLARRGVDGAVGELRHYLRTGRDLGRAIDALVPFHQHAEARGLLDDVLEVADDEQLRWALDRSYEFSMEPWPQWRRASTRIDLAITDAERPRAAPIGGLRGRAARNAADRARILRAAADAGLIPENSTPEISDESWEAILWDVAIGMLEDRTFPPTVRIALRRQLRQLRSARALAWARLNADLDGNMGGTALALLTELAESSDVPRLFSLLVASASGGNAYIYDQCSLIDTLTRLGHQAAVPTVEAIFDTTIYSYLRTRCAVSLSSLSPEFASGRAVECLTDCEAETRGVGIAHVDVSVSGVREALGRVAGDGMEEDGNRWAAAVRVS